MSEIIAEGMHNDQRVITVKSISGDPVTLNEKIAEVVVDTGSGKQRCVAVKQFGGGGGGGTDDYNDLENRPKVNNVTLSGNKTGSDLGLVDDVQINGTSVVTSGVANIPVGSTTDYGVVMLAGNNYGLVINAQGKLVINPATNSQIDAKTNGYLPIVPATLNYAVRSVSPACTTITASNTTATLVANTTYAHAVSSSGCTYTLTTPTDLTVYSGFILMIDTTNSASIAFQTDDSPATSIVLNGNPTVQTGKRYTVTGQYSVLNNAWELWIIEYSAT